LRNVQYVIIETLRNYLTHELLYDNLSSEVAPLQRKLLAAIFGGKLFGGSILQASAALVISTIVYLNI